MAAHRPHRRADITHRFGLSSKDVTVMLARHGRKEACRVRVNLEHFQTDGKARIVIGEGVVGARHEQEHR